MPIPDFEKTPHEIAQRAYEKGLAELKTHELIRPKREALLKEIEDELVAEGQEAIDAYVRETEEMREKAKCLTEYNAVNKRGEISNRAQARLDALQ